MKKLISTLLIVLILFNFILCIDTPVFATTGEDIDSLMNGTANTENGAFSITWNILGAIFGTIAGILAAIADLFPMLMQLVMTAVAGGGNYGTYTIEDTVFGNLNNFNVNYFNIDENGTSTMDTFKQSIAKVYVELRLIAIALSLLILIYVGIRMAISTLSDDKAKYKKMLMGWVESMVILFLMPYIMAFLMNLADMFVEMLRNIKVVIDAGGDSSFEAMTIDTIYSSMLGNSGWNYVVYSIIFWFLIFIQTKFFLMYFTRVITIGFLIMIAPLISVIYPIDKVGDGTAQSFNIWLSEFCMNLFIQPIHAAIYLVFMYTAGAIAQYSMLVALFLLLALTKVEKMVLHIFNLKNVKSLKPVDDQRKK